MTGQTHLSMKGGCHTRIRSPTLLTLDRSPDAHSPPRPWWRWWRWWRWWGLRHCDHGSCRVGLSVVGPNSASFHQNMRNLPLVWLHSLAESASEPPAASLLRHKDALSRCKVLPLRPVLPRVLFHLLRVLDAKQVPRQVFVPWNRSRCALHGRVDCLFVVGAHYSR